MGHDLWLFLFIPIAPMGYDPIEHSFVEEKTMFDIAAQLFEGQNIRFAPIDYDKDPEVESKWMHDAEFARLYDVGPARPLSPAMVKKQYEKLEKRMEEEKNFYHFMIRTKSDDRLIG